jgi:branched-chain amino acid transport system substrate-binding protein
MSPTNKRRRSRLSAALAAAALAVTSLSACGGSSSAGGTDPLTLGLLAPMTGSAAADGKLMEQGAQLAIDELNAKGGVTGRQVKLQTSDVRDLKSDAVSAAVAKFTSDSNVAAVVTGYASTTNFEIDQLAEAGIPYILGGGSTQTADIIKKSPDRYQGIWSVAPSYDGYGTDLPQQLDKWNSDGTFPLRNRKAYIISSDNPYSNGIAAGLQKSLTDKGWTVTGPDTVPFGEVNDWTTQLAKIRQVDPSLVVNLDYLTANAAKFVTQFRQNPSNSLVVSQYAPSVPEFIDLTGENANGVLYNLPFAPLQKLPETKELEKKFKDKYGTGLSLYNVALYEEVMLWAKAAGKVGDASKREEVGAAIGTLDEKTVFGRVHFDPATHLAISGADGVPMTYYQIQSRQRVTIAPAEYADNSLEKPSWIR